MARARKVSNEEPEDRGVNPTADTESDNTDDSAERANDFALHSTLDRVRPREDLRTCALCSAQDIPPEKFRAHILTEHKPKPQTVPSGYYGCWSGLEFWWPMGPMKGPCKWICSVCGKVKWYWGEGNTHGGPPERLQDRRYGLAYCEGGRYPSHKRYLGKIDGMSGPVIFYHEGAPNPEQPVQDDPSLAPFIKEPKSNAKGVQGAAKRKSSRDRNGETVGRTGRARRVTR